MDIRSGELPSLQNSLVLHHIFERCSLEDLKSCRLVSRLWRDTSRVAWRSSAVAVINSYQRGLAMPGFQQFSRNYENEQGRVLMTDAPFTNCSVFREDSQWFCDSWGSFLKVLKLTNVKFQNGDIFVKSIFNCCQNLEKLTLTNVTVGFNAKANADLGNPALQVSQQIDWNGIQANNKLKTVTLGHFEWTGVAWREILVRLPSLQILTLNISISNSEQLFQSLKTLLDKSANKLKLRMLPAYLPPPIRISSGLSQVLLHPNLSLETLNTEGRLLLSLTVSLQDILNSHASSLKTVFLRNKGLAESRNLRLSNQKTLENLQKLHYYSIQVENYRLVNLLRLAPNLRKVAIFSSSVDYLQVRNLDMSGTQDVRFNYCSELNLNVISGPTIEGLKLLINWMPNLRKLKIRELNNEMLSTVCERWQDLVSLETHFPHFNDVGITGLDDEDVEEINRNREQGAWRPVTVSRANITNLKG